ncbi:hypothetical protein ACQEVX_15355 [Streptomyces syringium]|uniref:hypothetical protein n=1 Tax=Streptomyces syringium TaxID=76729 RepID=UPI003D8F08B5
MYDKESVRRPLPAEEPTSTSHPDVVERRREAAVEWRVTEVPPIETALWLVKPPARIRGTWEEPKEAGEWLGRQLMEYAPRFASARDRGAELPVAYVASAVERLMWGGDVSLGFYLGQPLFLSLALVTCSPNRTRPDLPCPAR